MSRFLVYSVLFVMCAAGVAQAAWTFSTPQLIERYGTQPSLWDGTIAYLRYDTGAVMYYNGSTSVPVYSGTGINAEIRNGYGSVAWRNYTSTPNTNDIFRWNGSTVVNLSHSPNIMDSELAAASNGDLLWTRAGATQMYYRAATGQTFSWTTRGTNNALYVTETGVATYAYQDPDTNEVYYFDGTTMFDLGLGSLDGANPSVYDGAVAWVADGQGTLLQQTEIYFWKDGVTTRITNDDAVNGVPDNYPCVWHDLVVWQRNKSSAMRIWLWDGQASQAITSTRSQYPSFHSGRVAYEDWATGLHVLDLIPPPGDCSWNGHVDLPDFLLMEACFEGPDEDAADATCICADLDQDGDVDLADFATIQVLFGS